MAEFVSKSGIVTDGAWQKAVPAVFGLSTPSFGHNA